MKKELAIIGYGRFGRLASRYLKKDFRVSIHDPELRIRTERGVARVSLEEAARKKLIVLAVPINKLRTVLRKLSPLLRPGALVCDVCSVKEEPVRWMRSLLPRHTSVLGTHPLFGPDSASRSWRGKTIILCPVRISGARLRHVSKYLEKRGLTVRYMKPGRHDALMASSLFLTQFIGHVLLRLRLPRTEISTDNYKRLAEIARTTGRDTLEMLNDMHAFNPRAWKVPPALLREFRKLHRQLIHNK